MMSQKVEVGGIIWWMAFITFMGWLGKLIAGILIVVAGPGAIPSVSADKLIYIKDQRMGLCFATYPEHLDFDGKFLASVPCEAVKDFIVPEPPPTKK